MANLGQLIPALFVKDGELLTPEQIKRRQALSANALAVATDTSPNAGGVASILAKGLAGFRAGLEENRANAATAASGKENQSLIAGLLGGLGGGGTGQVATVAAPIVAPVQNVAPAEKTQAAPTTVDLSGDKQSFINALLPAAIEEGARTGVDPRIIVAQAAQETGWGRSAPGNNYFGIKSHGQSGGQNLTTHEVINGQRVKINDSFRTFGSPEESVRGYGDFILNNKRYQPLREAQGLDNQLAALQASGYATDPNYSRSVGAIARSIQLPQGQSVSPPQAQPSTGVNPAIIAALSSPVANEQTRSVAGMLLNNQFSQQEEARRNQQQRDNWLFQQDYQQQQQANDPLRQLQIQQAQQKLAQGPNADENFYGNPVAIQNADGTVAYGQIGNRGTFKPIQLGEGQSFAPPTRTVDAGTETILMDQAGNVISRTPKNNRTAAAETAGGTVEGRVAAERATSASADIQAGQNALDILDQIQNHPGMDIGTGTTSLGNRIPGTPGYDFNNIVEQAKSGAFLSAIQQMRGLGALSNNEGAAATSAITRMDTATSKDAFMKALGDYRKIVQQGIDRAQKNRENAPDAATIQQDAPKRRKYNPATGMLE